MPRLAILIAAVLGMTALACTGETAESPAGKAATGGVRTGAAALGDWRDDAPGVWRKITLAELPPATGPAPLTRNNPQVAPRPEGAMPQAMPGFTVTAFATGLQGPRRVTVAPNGDVFVAESFSGRIRVLRAAAGAGAAETTEIFASGAPLMMPFGIAFYPANDPQWVYVANTNSVIRFPYRAGDLKARGPAETVVAKITEVAGGHWTRDIVFSADGKRMFISVGSQGNVAENLPARTPEEIAAWDAAEGVGATWGNEAGRAEVRVYDVATGAERAWATGLRNCVGLAHEPVTQDLWCVVNERDILGDDLVPDYATRVRDRGFYGWPWYYLGDNLDPRHPGARPDLRGKVTVPDVLFPSHSAALQIAFYPRTGGSFPREYAGEGFVALHGSWNRSKRTGYKVVRLRLVNGVPTGEFQDFLTGFVIDDARVWGRPVGVAVARDGALLVTDDGSHTVWRVAWTGR